MVRDELDQKRNFDTQWSNKSDQIHVWCLKMFRVYDVFS